VTQLRKKVLEELERRNYSQATANAYVAAIRRFAEYFHRSPDQLGRVHVRQYQLHLVQERKLEPKSVMVQMAALRFLYLKVLRRSYSRDDIPLPKLSRRRIPIVLSTDEVRRLIDAAPNLRYRTILMTLYDTGMRRVANGWIFPSLASKRANDPITDKVVWHACREPTLRAGFTKPLHPHTLHHSSTTHMLDHGADLPVIQVLLGHEDPRDTMLPASVHAETEGRARSAGDVRCGHSRARIAWPQHKVRFLRFAVLEWAAAGGGRILREG
jgi:site-specific recombinase XerD